jgi:hypothetical protein
MKTTKQMVRAGSAALILALGLCLPLRSTAATALEITVGGNPLLEPQPDLVFGWEFSLSQPIQITHFGLFDAGLDGFNRDYKIKIWSVSGPFTPVAAGTGGPSTAGPGPFSYVAVSDVFLDPGHYVIAAGGLSFDSNDLDLMPSAAASITTDPVITFVQARYGINSGHDEDLIFPDVAQPGMFNYFGPNFQFVVVPEPSISTLFALGLLGGLWTLWRKKNAA